MKKGSSTSSATEVVNCKNMKKNYAPFLLEMQAAIFGMETFDVYLRGRKFLLFTDHKPLEKLGKVHSKTLNRLQQMMNSFDFEIIYKKGSEMPADFFCLGMLLMLLVWI